MLISETHYTTRSYLRIPKYKLYHTNHPDGTAHGGTAVIIRDNIKHHKTNSYIKNHLQATSIVVEDWSGPVTFSAVYYPPRHSIKKEQFTDFFTSLGHRFVAGGYNAKNVHWGFKLTLPRGRELLQAINNLHMNAISTGEPTYWPSDPKKLPDLIDFSITKGVSSHYIKCESCSELSSDHSPVLITLSRQILTSEKSLRLHNRKTNWTSFRDIVKAILDLNIPLKTDDNIMEAVEHFNKCVQSATWDSTPANQDIRLPDPIAFQQSEKK